MWDGDAIFSLATGEVDAMQGSVEGLAEETVAEAIRRVRYGSRRASGAYRRSGETHEDA